MPFCLSLIGSAPNPIKGCQFLRRVRGQCCKHGIILRSLWGRNRNGCMNIYVCVASSLSRLPPAALNPAFLCCSQDGIEALWPRLCGTVTSSVFIHSGNRPASFWNTATGSLSKPGMFIITVTSREERRVFSCRFNTHISIHGTINDLVQATGAVGHR